MNYILQRESWEQETRSRQRGGDDLKTSCLKLPAV